MTVETSETAIELLARFFREEEFAMPLLRIAENFDRMLADPFCWSALAVEGETAEAIINRVALARSAISTCFRSTAATAWHVALSNTPRLGAVPRAAQRYP